MELKEAIYSRRSIRDFKDESVDKELISKLIDAGIHAPSAMNQQPWSFAIIQEKSLLKQISDDAKLHFLSLLDNVPNADEYRNLMQNPDFCIFHNAPNLLMVYAKPGKVSSGGPLPEFDCSLAVENIMLTAYSLGLGTCWIGFAMPYLNSSAAKEKFGIPVGYNLVAPIILGYPTKDSLPPSTREEAEILFWK